MSSSLEMTLAKDLDRAWKKAEADSGCNVSEDGHLDSFWEMLEESTGLKQEMVVGMFIDWIRLPKSEQDDLLIRVPAEIPFCGYLAASICAVVGAAGMSTAGNYCGKD